MPGMGAVGSEVLGGFYPYLLIDLVILVAAVVALRVVRARRRSREPGAIPGPPARRFLLLVLGSIWILDGLLQAQPDMPGGFAQNVLAPAAQGVPGWLANVIGWEIYFWQAHPLDLAVATVLIQAGLGVAIIAGDGSRAGRFALWLSILWAIWVWVGGEGMGGLLAPGATEMMGAPGAVLLYAAGAGLLLLPIRLWDAAWMGKALRRGVGLVLLGGALLQALPFEGLWTGAGLAAMYQSMAQTPQPRFLSAPITALAELSQSHPVEVNAALVGIMAVLGLALLWGRAPRSWSVVALVWLVLVWWLGQDFGQPGSGTATDPNLSPLLAMLMLTAWISDRAAPGRAPNRVGIRGRLAGWRLPLAWGGLGALLVGLVPSLLGLPVAVGQSATIEALSIGGPLDPMGDQSLPSVTLTDQLGQQVNLRQWSHKVVVLTFLDPVCFDDCPIIAEQLAAADEALGALARRVEFVAVAANPVYRSLADVRSFDSEMQLTHLRNWRYLTGPLPTLEETWADFDLDIELPRLQMVDHPLLLYFVRPGDQEVSMAQDATYPAPRVMTSYITLIEDQVRQLAGG